MVQPEIAKFARVCSYDRAGYGWSDSGPEPRSSLQIAREPKKLLQAAGEKGPYARVGHSMGGYDIRAYTGEYPYDVAGMVLVDAFHEDQVLNCFRHLRNQRIANPLQEGSRVIPKTAKTNGNDVAPAA